MTDATDEREREPESALMFLASALYTEILCMLNAENRQNHFHSDEKKKKEGRRKMDAGKQRDINVGNHALTGVATFYLFSLTRSMCVSVSERRHSFKVEAIASVKLLQNKWFFAKQLLLLLSFGSVGCEQTLARMYGLSQAQTQRHTLPSSHFVYDFVLYYFVEFFFLLSSRFCSRLSLPLHFFLWFFIFWIRVRVCPTVAVGVPAIFAVEVGNAKLRKKEIYAQPTRRHAVRAHRVHVFT